MKVGKRGGQVGRVRFCCGGEHQVCGLIHRKEITAGGGVGDSDRAACASDEDGLAAQRLERFRRGREQARTRQKLVPVESFERRNHL